VSYGFIEDPVMERRAAWMIAVGVGLSAPFFACKHPSVPTAEVHMTWTIDGEDSAARCAAHKADEIEIAITGPAGEHVDTSVHRCFAAEAIDINDWRYTQGAAVTLPVGSTYVASARLKDGSGNPITTAATATVSPSAAEPSPEVRFEFGGKFTNGTGSASSRD
jgi:hypothetical protein